MLSAEQHGLRCAREFPYLSADVGWLDRLRKPMPDLESAVSTAHRKVVHARAEKIARIAM